MLEKLWNGESKTVTSAALLLGGASLASRLLGVLRDRALASSYGAGDVLDAYYAAFRLPDVVFNLLVFGALSAGFVPVLTEYLVRREGKAQEDAWRLVNEVLGILAVALGVVTVLLIALAPVLVPLITPGFHGPKLELTITLSRIMFLSPLLLGLSAVFGGVLQSTKRFFAFAVAPLFYNLGIIIGATLFTHWWGFSGLAIGVVFGAFLHFASQFLPVAGLGFKFAPHLKPADDGVRTIARLSLPRIIALAVTQIDVTVATVIASLLAAGSITVFNLANNLQMMPVAFIGISYALAAFPTLSRYAAKNEKEQFIQSVNGVTRQILFFVVPFALIFMLLRAQIVRVVLGAGQFDWSDTIRTADALAFFSLSIAAQALIPFLIRAFYALKDSTTPLLVSGVSVGVGVIGTITLGPALGVRGLALAVTIASLLHVMLLWVTLRLKLGTLNETVLVRSLMKITAAAAPMALVIQLTKNAVGPLVDMQTFVGIFTQGLVAGLAGLATYLGVALLVRSEEARGFALAFRRRVASKELPLVGAEEAVE